MIQHFCCSLFWHIFKRSFSSFFLFALQNWHKLLKFYIWINKNRATCLCRNISFYITEGKASQTSVALKLHPKLFPIWLYVDKWNCHSTVNILLVEAYLLHVHIMNKRQTCLRTFLTLLSAQTKEMIWNSKRGGNIVPVFHWSCTNPTLSSILLSLDPIELVPLSLARSSGGDNSQVNYKTGGLGLWFVP